METGLHGTRPQWTLRPADQSETCVWCLFQRTGGGVGGRRGWRGVVGCGAESKGWDLLFQSEKELMVDHRNSGSEIHGVPRGQLVQWHPPLSLPAVRLPAAICGQRLALGERICTSVWTIQAFERPPIKGEREKFTWRLLVVLWFNCLFKLFFFISCMARNLQ